MCTLLEVAGNNVNNMKILAELSEELQVLQKEIILKRKKQLKLENNKLSKEVLNAISQLVSAEARNGKKNVTVPKVIKAGIEGNNKSENKSQNNNEKPLENSEHSDVNVSKLDLRVGKIVEVNQHPDADKLYVEKIDCGEPTPRTVVSGLVQFVPLNEMQNRMVVVLCNLKPAKMRGITSEAMVMCASTPERVELLSPPAGASPGDLVHCEGYNRQPEPQLNPKKKIFETCAPDLMTNDQLVACYKRSPLYVPTKGNLTAQTLKNVNIK